MSKTLRIVPTHHRDPLKVATLVGDGLAIFEYAMAAEIFCRERPGITRWYDHVTVAETAEPLSTIAGAALVPEAGLDALDDAGTIVIPGWSTGAPAPSPALAAALSRAAAEGARFVSICSGAFLLAELGLLDGKRATTHWVYADAFRARYPRVALDPDILFADEGAILTSAGSAAGIDCLLHLVARDFGHDVANKVAQRLVVAPHRDGGQRQFIPTPLPPAPHARIAPLLDAMRAAPASDWNVETMARACAMSRRTFIRRFTEATGETPGAWLAHLRLSAARHALEATDASIERVATEAGYGSLSAMQAQFKKVLGLSPSAYRRRFGARSDSAA
ncbi:helix-turn-helix domain-containing protein [Sphingomicrobium arenosum]|uniref:helix-turn-helix domain-containing protein n=1 Tax=Sphingomicrobium arenosum TaxID=2233861 RepID=UPI002240280A|nr:helix-turn-helix domain-containing protein [Sphingomicrobium arenosum]